jgi:dTDP-4-dehydrorhamnose 3,5-epimerase
MLDGLLITPLQIVKNLKGDIYHALKASSPGYQGFGEAYFSSVSQGVIKGWKRHNRFTLNLIVPAGDIRFIVYDDRPSKSTYGQFTELRLGVGMDCNYARLTVSPGLWIAFQGMGEFNLLLNIIAAEHDPDEADNKDIADIPYPRMSTSPPSNMAT